MSALPEEQEAAEAAPSRKLKIAKWDPGSIARNCTMLLIGRRGTGKSSLLLDLAYHMAKNETVDVGVGMSPTESSSECLGKFLPTTMIYSGYSEKKVQELMDMGFDKETVEKHLRQCGGDKNRAIESILGAM